MLFMLNGQLNTNYMTTILIIHIYKLFKKILSFNLVNFAPLFYIFSKSSLLLLTHCFITLSQNIILIHLDPATLIINLW